MVLPSAQSDTRSAIANAKRLVVKIGSSSLTLANGGLDVERVHYFAKVLEQRMQAGTDLVLVSSGAVAAGMKPLGLVQRPQDLATKQAAAAAGQARLARYWADAFSTYDRVTAQVLLTSSDLGSRRRATNAQSTIDRLRQLGAIPVINENDTVANSDLNFGDNDRLAALVAHLISADAMILLSDVEALYDKDPRLGDAHPIREVAGPEDLEGTELGAGGALGTGGMASKVNAARLAARAGIPVLMGSSAQAIAALGGATNGTAFAPDNPRLTAWEFWVLFTARTRGEVIVDEGARVALVERGKSLLSAGITDIRGQFTAGDVVDIIDHSGTVIGRGEPNFNSVQLRSMLGKSMNELPEEQRRSAIHADHIARYRFAR